VSCEIKVILFDLDDTLYSRESGVMQRVSQLIVEYMVQRLGLEPARATALRRGYLQRYGTTMRGLQADFQIDTDDYLAYVHNFPVEEILQPNSALDRLLANIAAEKIIFTNATVEHARRVLAALRIERHFSRIFDIVFLGYVNKPDPRAYQQVLEAMKAQPHECLLVDNAAHNLRPAKSLGMTTVLVGDQESEEADFVIDDILELSQVLEVANALRTTVRAVGPPESPASVCEELERDG
jgi:putative hydrolase of the HAD superfamily